MRKLFAAVAVLTLAGMGGAGVAHAQSQEQRQDSTEIEQNGDWVDRHDSGIGGAGVDESVGGTPQSDPVDNRHLPNRDEFGTGFNDNDQDDADGTGGAGMEGEGAQPGMDGENAQPGMEGEVGSGSTTINGRSLESLGLSGASDE